MKENPRDPEEIKQPGDTNDYPSFFAFPEWEAFKEKYNMWEVRVELGAFGHETRKPTTLGTNLPLLRYLVGKTGGGVGGGSQPVTLDEKIKRSKAWAVWPVKFKEEVVRAIEDELDDPAIRKSSGPSIGQMTTCIFQRNVLPAKGEQEGQGHIEGCLIQTLTRCRLTCVGRFGDMQIKKEVWESTSWWVCSPSRSTPRPKMLWCQGLGS